jgi:hypothetical protein
LIHFGLIALTVLGLLAKESAALLPLYAFCVAACVFRFRNQAERRDPWLFVLFAIVLVLPANIGLAWLLPGVLSPSIGSPD